VPGLRRQPTIASESVSVVLTEVADFVQRLAPLVRSGDPSEHVGGWLGTLLEMFDSLDDGVDLLQAYIHDFVHLQLQPSFLQEEKVGPMGLRYA
jgi:hypothetical protein